MELLNIALPIVYALVGVALVWFVIELVLTVRTARKTVKSVKKQIDPTLESVGKITASLEPAVANVNRLTEQLQPTIEHVGNITASLEPVSAKIDPLVDRVSLTVDAANLEIMRVDQILEDVTQITESVSNTLDTVDTVTNAPLELVNSVTDRVRSRLKPRYASKESERLGQTAPAGTSPVRDFVDAASDVAGAAVSDQRARMQERKDARVARNDAAHARNDALDETATAMTDTIVEAVQVDTPGYTTVSSTAEDAQR